MIARGPHGNFILLTEKKINVPPPKIAHRILYNIIIRMGSRHDRAAPLWFMVLPGRETEKSATVVDAGLIVSPEQNS